MVSGSTAPSRQLVFAHPSEREFARTPDFYLPDLDLYVELTTMRQRLVTRKNRKLRRLQERYPEVNVRLLYKRDYYELLAKYGYLQGEVELPQFDALLRDAEHILFSQRQVSDTVR